MIPRNHVQPYRKVKQTHRAHKLNAISQETLVFYFKRFSYNSFAIIGTLFKPGSKFSSGTLRSYLKAAGYLLFKACQKLFVAQNHRDARLR